MLELKKLRLNQYLHIGETAETPRIDCVVTSGRYTRLPLTNMARHSSCAASARDLFCTLPTWDSLKRTYHILLLPITGTRISGIAYLCSMFAVSSSESVVFVL
jgi:hypothetical protein